MERFAIKWEDYQRLIERCAFTDEERCVLDLRRRGLSVVQIGMKLNVSPRTVDRRLDSIKNKIAREMA
jgi:DNA-binding NarL/FixJ family response regulator